MSKIFNWFYRWPKQLQDSASLSLSLLGIVSIIFSILGTSLREVFRYENIWVGILIVVGLYAIVLLGTYYIKGVWYKDSVTFFIHNTKVSIFYGNIFDDPAWRVIGCDTHFSTVVDNDRIAETSLHGQLILRHAKKEEVVSLVCNKAEEMGLKEGADGLYNFPLGTIIRYVNRVEDRTYLLLAMTELDEKNQAHINMANYESMLMKMWSEISRVYAGRDVALPLLCSGITRFDNGPKDNKALLKCMLCTLNSSMIDLKSELKIVLNENPRNKKEIPLYEFKNMF